MCAVQSSNWLSCAVQSSNWLSCAPKFWHLQGSVELGKVQALQLNVRTVSGNISAKALYHNNASIQSESGAITVGAMHGAAFAFFLISRTIMGWLMGSRREGGCAHQQHFNLYLCATPLECF